MSKLPKFFSIEFIRLSKGVTKTLLKFLNRRINPLVDFK